MAMNKEFVHAFRLNKEDEDKLNEIQDYYREASGSTKWRIGNTMEVLIREVHRDLLREGKIIEKEATI